MDALWVDDLAFGRLVRIARIRRGWRQVDLARAAGVSDSTVSRIERGRLDGVPLGTLRAVGAALEIRLELLPRARHGDAERLVNARHSTLGEAVVAWVRGFGGWEARPEVSFNWFGERGVIDVLAWHADAAVSLQIELKTEIVDAGELLATLDRRRRLGTEIAAPLGWQPRHVATLLVVGDSETNRRRVRALRDTFDAALPDRIAAVRAFLRRPSAYVTRDGLRGLIFFSDSRHRKVGVQFAAPRRVQRPRSARTRDQPTPGAEFEEESPLTILR